MWRRHLTCFLTPWTRAGRRGASDDHARSSALDAGKRRCDGRARFGEAVGDSVPVAGAPTTSGQPCGLALHARGLALLRRAIPAENVFGLALAGRAEEVRHHDGIYESPPGRGGQSRRWVAEASTGRLLALDAELQH